MGPVEIPNELDLLSFFSVEPSTEGHTICYSVEDNSKLQLKFYFDQVSNNVGFILSQNALILVKNSFEELKQIQIIKKNNLEVLLCECTYSDCHIKIELSLHPKIRVSCESISI